MAKKGAVVALQIDISTEEDWEKLLTEKHGVILVDVYTEWCGPCVGMCGNLRKVKLEIGGENITYITAKSDTIEDLARFRKKSEPTWMFISEGRMTNLMFGPDGPRLMRMIVDEVKKEQAIRAGLKERVDMAITDIAPEEQKRFSEIEELQGEAIRVEKELQLKKLNEHRMEVAQSVADGMPDHSILLLWPHAVEAFSPTMEICEGLEIQMVTFEKFIITEEQAEECFFGVEMPLSREAIKCLLKGSCMSILLQAKEDFAMPSIEEALIGAIESIGDKWLLEYTPELFEEPKSSEEDEMGEEEYMMEHLQTIATDKTEPPPPSDVTTDVTSYTDRDDISAHPDVDMSEIHGEWAPEFVTEVGQMPPSESGIEDGSEEEQYEEEEAHEAEPIIIQGLYTPTNAIARGAALATLFPAIAFEFIPPPPVPVPPHVAIIFDAFKKKDVIDMVKDNIQYVMNMGFFSSADPTTAKLVAKTNREFDKKRPGPGQKLVIMVMKKPSAGLLSLAQLGPIYVSPNADVGEEECKKFFPAGFSEGEFALEEPEAPPLVVSEAVAKKKKKGKDAKKGEDAEDTDKPESTEAEQAAADAGLAQPEAGIEVATEQLAADAVTAAGGDAPPLVEAAPPPELAAEGAVEGPPAAAVDAEAAPPPAEGPPPAEAPPTEAPAAEAPALEAPPAEAPAPEAPPAEEAAPAEAPAAR